MKNQRNKTKRKLKGGMTPPTEFSMDPPTEFSMDELMRIWESSTVEMLKLNYEIDHRYNQIKNAGTMFKQRRIDLNNACSIIETVVPVEENKVSETAKVHVIKNDLGIPKDNYYYKYTNASVSELNEFCSDKEKHLKDFKNTSLDILCDDISRKSNDLLLLDVNKLFDIINKKTKKPLYELTKEEFEYVQDVKRINNRLNFKTAFSKLDPDKINEINEIKSIVEQKKKDLLDGKYKDVKSWISEYSTQHQKTAAAYIRSFFSKSKNFLGVLGGNKRSRKSKQSRKHIRKSRKSNK